MMMSYYIIIYQCVAPFPTKRFIGSFGDSFILTRRVKLQQWLRGVISILPQGGTAISSLPAEVQPSAQQAELFVR